LPLIFSLFIGWLFRDKKDEERHCVAPISLLTVSCYRCWIRAFRGGAIRVGRVEKESVVFALSL
jgi:hypothetical protein